MQPGNADRWLYGLNRWEVLRMNLKRLSLFVICCVVVLGMTSLATAAMQ